MTQRNWNFGVSIVTLMLAGCGGPKIDASSEQAFKNSTEAIMKTLDGPTKEKFSNALGMLMARRVMFAPGSIAEMEKKVRDTFDGKTVNQIIADGLVAEDESKTEMKKMMNGG